MQSNMLPLLGIVIVLLYIFSCLNILREYERGVVFRLGRLLPDAKGPGWFFIWKPIYQMVRVSLRTVTLDVPPQDIITRDNVSVKVNAIVYFRVMNAPRAIVEIENYLYATSQLAQTRPISQAGRILYFPMVTGTFMLDHSPSKTTINSPSLLMALAIKMRFVGQTVMEFTMVPMLKTM